jgi:uncharacterized membrane protein YcaP (DUF421 family)
MAHFSTESARFAIVRCVKQSACAESMHMFLDIDWAELFSISMPVAEIIVRGTAIYWFLFLIFRFLLRRDIGAVGVADILILVLVADAAQNAMSGTYTSISEGFVLIATLIGWDMLFDWLSYRFLWFRGFAEAKPLCLIKDGKLIRQNLRKEYITEEELWVKLRTHGIDSLRDVKRANLEPDGDVSVIRYKDKGRDDG